MKFKVRDQVVKDEEPVYEFWLELNDDGILFLMANDGELTQAIVSVYPSNGDILTHTNDFFGENSF